MPNSMDLESLIGAQQDKSRGYRTRLDAVEALGETGDARAVEPLMTAPKDEDESVRWAAANVLQEIDPSRS